MQNITKDIEKKVFFIYLKKNTQKPKDKNAYEYHYYYLFLKLNI
jgi:hypothetical protein